MKRTLQAIGAVVVAAMPHAALALEADMALDRFPSHGGREWHGGGDATRVEVVRAYRDGGHGDRHATWRDDHRGYDRVSGSGWRESGRYRSSGSLIDVRTIGGSVERGSFYGTSGTANSSFIVIAAPDGYSPNSSFGYGGLSGGAKILDVEADRLDRQPYGKDGLAVAHVGTAKIIRIAPDFRRGMERDVEESAATDTEATPFAELPREERAVTVYPDTDMAERPVDPPAPRVAQSAPPTAAPTPAPTPAATPAPAPAAGFLEPWTPDWLRDCVARHADFDASLGTYTAADGKRRFCTGEP